MTDIEKAPAPSTGNTAELREAREKMLSLLMLRGDGKAYCILSWDEFNDSQKMLRAALSAPPRNCDVGTAEEQEERFILFCHRNSFRGVCNDSCKFANVNRRLGWQEIGQARCFPFWAQMPYEEGGAK